MGLAEGAKRVLVRRVQNSLSRVASCPRGSPWVALPARARGPSPEISVCSPCSGAETLRGLGGLRARGWGRTASPGDELCPGHLSRTPLWAAPRGYREQPGCCAWGQPWGHFGDSQGTDWGIAQGQHGDSLGDNLGTDWGATWGQPGDSQGTVWGQPGDTLGTALGHLEDSLGTPWGHQGKAWVIPWGTA